MVKNIFFQSSLPRAGSTLLQNLIAQNPEFYATPTSGVTELLTAARNVYTHNEAFRAQDSDLMKTAFQGFCKDGLHGYFNAITDKPYILDKSREWGSLYDFANFFGEKPKIICMLRDPRAIFASMEKNYRKHPDKSVYFGEVGPMDTVTTENRVQLWASNPPVGLSLLRLHEIIRRGNDGKMLFVKYEDLVKQPDKQMNRIYEYLGVKPFKHDFKNIPQVTQEDDRVYGVFGDHTIQNTLNIHKPDYIEILGRNICEWIRKDNAWFYDYFQYQ